MSFRVPPCSFQLYFFQMNRFQVDVGWCFRANNLLWVLLPGTVVAVRVSGFDFLGLAIEIVQQNFD